MTTGAAGLDPRLALLHVLKAPMIECAAHDADWMVTAVGEDEIGFYRRMLNMEILSGAEPCPGSPLPRVLMGLQFRENAALVYKRVPLLSLSLEDISEYALSGTVRIKSYPRG
jgi:hypothetical protein